MNYDYGLNQSDTNRSITITTDNTTYPTYTTTTPSWVPGINGHICTRCGQQVGTYQVHSCWVPTPQFIPQRYNVLDDHIRAQEEARIAALEGRIKALEEALQDPTSRLLNDQDEEVHVHSDEGYQGTDEGGSSSRDRKGDWYWPSSSS